ncbi:MAG: putative sulfate exporter family transporter [Candidatus Odyssella sp.]|nr:putative sulfate exporter family transporter [Candidatus Odyssella sp.]
MTVNAPGKSTPAAAAARVFPGVAVAAVIAMASTFLSEHYGGPVMLFALLIGMAFHFLSQEGRCARGIDFAARTVLRLGVALLGFRISVDQLAALGWRAPLVTCAAVAATILLGMAAARAFRQSAQFGILTGGAVAICGASAALAIASVLPKHANTERDTIFAVIGVTTLSTAAMVIYPPLMGVLGLGDADLGFLLGATIHDVAQVVGAGYSVSTTAGDVATISKLMRVALLVPVVATLALVYRSPGGEGARRGLMLPWFLVAFVAFAAASSAGIVPKAAADYLNHASRWCLVIAIAALGMKTSLAALGKLGWRPVALMVAETAFLAAVVVAVML